VHLAHTRASRGTRRARPILPEGSSCTADTRDAHTGSCAPHRERPRRRRRLSRADASRGGGGISRRGERRESLARVPKSPLSGRRNRRTAAIDA
jgi:hypothetical protein